MSDIRLDIDGTRRHEQRRRRLLGAGGVAALLLAVATAALPTLLSSSWGNSLLLQAVNARIAGVVTLDEAWTGWLGGSGARRVKLVDSEGALVFEGTDIDTDAGFFGLLRAACFGGVPATELSVSVERADLWRGEDGRLNLARSLARTPAEARAEEAQGQSPALEPGAGEGQDRGWRETLRWAGGGVAAPPQARLSVSVDSLRWRPGIDAVATQIDDLTAELDGRNPDRVAASLEAQTQRAAESGLVNVSVVVLEGARGDGVLSAREAQVEMDARVSNLPLATLCEAVGLGQWVQAALGETVNVEARTRGRLGAPQGQVRLWTSRLDGSLEMVPGRSGVVATPSSHVRWTLTPAAFGALFERGDWTLEESSELNLSLASLELPEAAAGAQPEWASTGLEGSMGDLILRSADREIRLVGPRLRLESRVVGQRIQAALSANVRRGGLSSPVVLNASLINAKAPEEAGLPRLEASLVGFPTELLSALGPAGASASRLMGSTMSVEADALQVAPAGRLRLRPAVSSLSLTLASAGVNGAATLRYGAGGEWGVLSTPEPLRIGLSDERIGGRSLLGDLAEVRLAAPVQARVDLRELRWRQRPGASGPGPLAAGAPAGANGGLKAWLDPLMLTDCGLSGSITLERATLRGNAGGLVVVDDLLLDVAAARLEDTAEVFFSAIVVEDGAELVRGQSLVSTASKGSVTARAKASDLLDMKGRLNPTDAVVRASAEGRDLPVEVLDRLLEGDGRLAALLGPVIQPSVNLEAGPGHLPLLSGTFESEHGLAGLTTEIRDGELTVLPGAQLQLAITRAGADALRGRLHPLTMDLKESVRGSPARLLPPAGVVLRPWAGWQGWLPLLDNATLEAGGLVLHSRGWLGSAMAGTVRQRVSQLGGLLGESFEMRAEPTRIRFTGGMLSHGPLWLWSDTFAVGLRGEVAAIALPSEPSDPSVASAPADRTPSANEASRLSMTIGIPGVALRAMVPEFTRLPPANVYELPLGGWIDNPQVEFGGFQTELLLAGDGATLTSHLGASAGWRLPTAVRVGVAGFDRAADLATGEEPAAGSGRLFDDAAPTLRPN